MRWLRSMINIIIGIMKKAFLVMSIAGLMMVSGTGMAKAQEEPKPKKDTVNMDTNAKPEFYYATDDEKAAGKKGGSTATIAIICGVVVVAAGAGFFLLKKKK
jgi:flagellar basal body-associated protein FliL